MWVNRREWQDMQATIKELCLAFSPDVRESGADSRLLLRNRILYATHIIVAGHCVPIPEVLEGLLKRLNLKPEWKPSKPATVDFHRLNPLRKD